MRFRKQVALALATALMAAAPVWAQNVNSRLDRHGEGCAGRGAARRDRHRDVAGPDRLAGGRDGSQRELPVPVAAVGQLHAEVRPVGLQAVDAAEHHAGAGPDADRGRGPAARVAAGDGAGDGRVADRRHAVDVGGQHDGHGEADWRAELERPVGRAGPVAGRPDAGLRRGRQPQEPAVGVRRVRHLGADARHHRGRGHDRGDRRRRVLPGLLLAERDRGERGGPGRVDEHAGRGRHLDHQERR